MRFKRAGGIRSAAGGVLRSGLEKTVCDDLDKRGVKFEYEADKLSYQRSIRGGTCGKCGANSITRKASYTPDVKLSDGSYIEIKGRFTASNRSRMADFKRSNPNVRVRLLFAADNWCTKAKRQRYSDWAKANGFELAVGKRVPDAWIPK